MIFSTAMILYFVFRNKKELSVSEVNFKAFPTKAEDFYRKYNPDIMVYGEDFDFTEYMIVRRINQISYDEFSKEQKPYQALVLMDRFGQLEITDEEFLFIKKYCQDNKLDMYYFGTDKLDDFVRLGFSAEIKENELSFEYLGTQNFFGLSESKDEVLRDRSFACHGLFTEEDGDLQNDDKMVLICLLLSLSFNAESALLSN